VSKINSIGDVYIPTISTIEPSGENEIKRVDNKNTLDSYVYSIPSIIETLNVSGSLYTDDKTEDEYAEDVESIRFRSGAYNYIDIAEKRGFLEVASVSIPKDAETQTMRDYTLDCNFMSATMFERAYTLETSLYNSVINGQTYTVDHPPVVSLPVNAFNVKLKSPWQTIILKEPTFVMSSSEGKIPIYMPFKLYTSEDPTLYKADAPPAEGQIDAKIEVVKDIQQYGYGKIVIPQMENGAMSRVVWTTNIGVDVPLGTYKVAMKLGIRPIAGATQNVPEACHFECFGFSLTDSSSRAVSTPYTQKIDVTYDGIYYTEEMDVSNANEHIEMHFANPRVDAKLEIEYIYLVPTYHARVAYDAPSEYYSGETKIYDFYNGVAKRVYNVNHEFKGSIMVSNPFMRWIIDSRQQWQYTGDITHTRYDKTTQKYIIDDEPNTGMSLTPAAFNVSYPHVIIKKVLPNIIELEISSQDGFANLKADKGRMITTVHVTPYAFKFYNQCIGEFYSHWALNNKMANSAFSCFTGNIMCKYGDNYDNTNQENNTFVGDISSIVTSNGDYLYTLSFSDILTARVTTYGNVLFPWDTQFRGSYQFTLNVMPMIMDTGYNYSDDLICINESMQTKANSSISQKEYDISEDFEGNEDSFWNFFETIQGDEEDVNIESNQFTVSHTNAYAKNVTKTSIAIQNKNFEHFKAEFDVSMTRPTTMYVPEVTIKFLESADKATYHYVTIRDQTVDNVIYGIVSPQIGYYTFRNVATVDLNLLTSGTDHVEIEVTRYLETTQITNNISVNGTTIFNFGGDQYMFGPAPFNMIFSMMYGCSVTIKDLKVRPYFVTTQKFTATNVLDRYTIFEADHVSIITYIGEPTMQLSNDGTAILKSYKMLSGRYSCRFWKPNSGAATLLYYLNVDIDSSGPYNGLYAEIPSAGGFYYLKRSYEDGTIETLIEGQFPALVENVHYECIVVLDEVTRYAGIILQNISYPETGYAATISAIHFKYGKIGFKSAGVGSFIISGYDMCGIEKYGRGPQIKKYVDDFDFGPATGTLIAQEYNDGTTTQFTHDASLGIITDTQSATPNPFRVLYPNTINPEEMKVCAVIKSTRTSTGNKRAGILTTVDEFTATQTPVMGYGVFLNFYSHKLEVMVFDYTATNIQTPTTIFETIPSIISIEDNKLYNLTVQKTEYAIYIQLEDGKGNSQSFIAPININGIDRYIGNGYVALAGYNDSGQYGIMFDDFIIEDMKYSDTDTTFVTLGGVSHGGEYDTFMNVYDKVIPGVTIPFGYYYLVSNAHATADNTSINFAIKDYTDNTSVISTAFDGGSVEGVSFSEVINKAPDQFARYIIKLDSTHEGHECGIGVSASGSNYYQAIFLNYIIMVPFSGTIGKQIFLHEMEMINKSPSVIYRKLEKKKIS